MPMTSHFATPAVDSGFAFANDLFLFGWIHLNSEPTTVTLTDTTGRRLRLNIARYRRYVRSDALSHEAAGEDQYGFACAVELADLIGFSLFNGEVSISVETREGYRASGTIWVQTLSSEPEPADFSEFAGLTANLGLLDPKLANYLTAATARSANFVSRYAIDAACKSNSGFIAEGWIENARARDLSFLSSDGLSYIAASDVIFRTRMDVSDHLRSERCTSLTDDHGVVLNFPHCHSETNTFFILAEDQGAYVVHMHIEVPFSEDRGRLLQVVSQVGGVGKLPRPEQAKKLFRPFFVESGSASEYGVIPIKTASSKPKVSVIVPFYGEYRFIFSLLTMQKRFSSEFEWIFVSDEPAKHQLLMQVLEKRSDSLNCPTTLVLNRSNYGFSTSNNIGTAVASGDTLLFMNSDIWAETARPLSNAAKALDSGRFQIIGFRLLFEDGTIQHEGMSFERSAFLHNLFIVDHPQKGTPADQDINKIVEIGAVTGALLMIKKDLFLKIGGFDRAFIKGDFEDADLCLKARMNGGRIGLYKTGDLFHLERQSIRLMDVGSARMALTYLNCITFNERWGQFISREEGQIVLPKLALSGNRHSKRMEA